MNEKFTSHTKVLPKRNRILNARDRESVVAPSFLRTATEENVDVDVDGDRMKWEKKIENVILFNRTWMLNGRRRTIRRCWTHITTVSLIIVATVSAADDVVVLVVLCLWLVCAFLFSFFSCSRTTEQCSLNFVTRKITFYQVEYNFTSYFLLFLSLVLGKGVCEMLSSRHNTKTHRTHAYDVVWSESFFSPPLVRSHSCVCMCLCVTRKLIPTGDPQR